MGFLELPGKTIGVQFDAGRKPPNDAARDVVSSGAVELPSALQSVRVRADGAVSVLRDDAPFSSIADLWNCRTGARAVEAESHL